MTTPYPIAQSPTMRFRRLIVVVALVLSGVAPSFGQEPAPTKPLAALLKEWNLPLSRAEKSLARPDITDDALEGIRSELAELSAAVRAYAEQTRQDVEAIKLERDALGPPPEEGAPPEAANIADKRKAINERLTAAEGGIKEAELLLARIDRLLDQVSSLRRLRFTERITARGLPPLSPAVWRKALPELAEMARAAHDNLRTWIGGEGVIAQLRQMGWKLPVGVLTAIILAWPLRLWLLRRFGYVVLEGEPTYGQRLRTALFTGVIRTLLPSAAALAVYLALSTSDLLSENVAAVARVALISLVFLFFTAAFCRAALAPSAASWRLVAISDHAALSLSRIITALASVFALDWVLQEAANRASASLELVTVEQFLCGLLITLLLFALLRRRIWQPIGQASEAPSRFLRGLRGFLALLVFAIPLSALLGYVALSRLLATQLVLSAGLIVLLALIRKLGEEMIVQAFAPHSAVGVTLKSQLELSQEGSDAVAFWLIAALRLLLIVAGLLALPLLWGAGGDDITAWLYNAFFGFQVGKITISIADLLLAGVLFAGLLVLTRVLQRTLEQQVFPRTRIDAGVRHSIRSALGYAGFAAAALLAISTLGLDLSSLAIIAGALSVGVGFGLQNIVNNFVSGLILLVERPVKVGDWIVIGDQQGYVKKISVRATEITTFDRASVFVPNSSLISGPVMNRTYADRQGRVVLPVGLAFGSDVQKVRRVLLELADSHPAVLRDPPPLVLFRAFGDSALQFELIAYLGDVNRTLTVTSELCFAIEEAFRREGLEFAYPHRDIQLNLHPEQLERLLSRLAEGKGGGAKAVIAPHARK